MNKKIISLLSALTLTAQIVPCALADNDAKVYVNDTEMVTDAPIIIENDRTLVPVRAILEYLDYNVDWDGATQKVTIAKDETTLNLIIGDTQATRDIIYKGNTHSYKNPLEVAPQIINDSTYIPLSDVAKAFALNITWDSDNREVHITQYKKGDLTPLIEFGIISDDDLNKGEYITTQEALNTIQKFYTMPSESYFNRWYSSDKFESLNNIDDSSKKLLIHLHSRNLLTLDDIAELKLEDNLTNLQALTYTIRMTGSTYDCSSQIKEIRLSEPSDIYSTAYERNFIDSEDTANAQSPISRADFYELLNKILFFNYSRGGGAGIYTTSLYKTLQKQVS